MTASSPNNTSADLGIPTEPCAPWCDTPSGHDPKLHPEDRACWSEYRVVPLSLHDPLKYSDGRRRDFAEVYLRRRLGQAPRVVMHAEGSDDEYELTVAEAQQLAKEILRWVEEAAR